MYRCQICHAVVGPRVPLQRHVVLRQKSEGLGREKGTILREVPICPNCALHIGIAHVPLEDLLRGFRKEVVEPSPLLSKPKYACPGQQLMVEEFQVEDETVD